MISFICRSITVVQIDAGAEVIVTQPPLLWDKFEAWINSVQSFFRQRLLGKTRLIVGCPMVSSAANMKFWLYLCQASHLPEAASAVQPFTDAAAESKQCLAAYCQKYNADLVHRVSTAWSDDPITQAVA